MKNRFLKTTLVVLVTIVLGAIGSGVWEKIGNPLFDEFSRFLIETIDRLIGNYKDSIYLEASFGYREYAANSVYIMVIGIIPPLYVVLLVSHPFVRERTANNRRAAMTRNALRSASGFYTLSVLTLFIFSYTLVTVTRVEYTNAIVTFAETSIDRLAPYITDQEQKELLSEFRSVRNRDDYYRLYEKLVSLYEANGLEHHSRAPL